MKNQTAQELLSAGQMKEIISAVVEGIPSSIPASVAQKYIGKKKQLAKKVREIFTELASEQYGDLIAEWQSFYKKLFSLELDFSNVAIPEKPAGKYRLLIIHDFCLEKLYAKCKGLFPTWRWTNDDLDKIIVENERDAKNGVYAIWVKDVDEADEDLCNMSANNIKAKGLTTETLAERFIHELKFFDETAEHLDVNNVTLCSGSRYSVANVPRVHWSYGKMHVHWYNVGDSDDFLRARSVVSL